MDQANRDTRVSDEEERSRKPQDLLGHKDSDIHNACGTAEKGNKVKRELFVKLSEAASMVRDRICRGRIDILFLGKGGTGANMRPVMTLVDFCKIQLNWYNKYEIMPNRQAFPDIR